MDTHNNCLKTVIYSLGNGHYSSKDEKKSTNIVRKSVIFFN